MAKIYGDDADHGLPFLNRMWHHFQMMNSVLNVVFGSAPDNVDWRRAAAENQARVFDQGKASSQLTPGERLQWAQQCEALAEKIIASREA